MLLEVEGGYKIENPTKGQVFNELSSLDGVDKTFIVLENNLGCYIQVGGGSDEFTVEVRIYSSANEYKHWKAERSNIETTKMRSINIAGSQVNVKQSQVLNENTVQKLMESFIDGELLCACVKWSDITSMFL